MAQPILIIGQNGQIARELGRVAQEQSIEVDFAGRERCDLAAGEDPGPLIDRARPLAVINAAAYTAVDLAESETEAAFRLNRDAPGRLAQLCAERDLPFVHYSTDYVFDGTKSSPYVEDDERRPRCVYGATKAAGEDAVLTAGGRALILRTSWVFSDVGVNFLKTMLRLGGLHNELRVVSDQLGQPTWARDAAAAGLAAVRSMAEQPSVAGVMHAAGAEELSWAEFAEMIFSEVALRGGDSTSVRRISTAEYPTIAQRPKNSRLNTDRITEALGWRATPVRQAVANCLDELERAQ